MKLPVRHMLLLIPQKDYFRVGFSQAGCSPVYHPDLISAEFTK